MVDKYKVLLLHVDLFLKQMNEQNKSLKSVRAYDEYKKRELLESLYKNYPLYLIGGTDKNKLIRESNIIGINDYFKGFYSLDKNDPSLGPIMYDLNMSNPEEYLVCGTNEEYEISMAIRAYMDSCYVGPSGNSASLDATYRVTDESDIKKVLKLQ